MYVMASGEVKVDSEKTKENGWPILATGGTWELTGKVIDGMAAENRAASKTSIQTTNNAAMIPSYHKSRSQRMRTAKTFKLRVFLE